MKKAIVFFLLLLMVLPLCACGSENKTANTATTSSGNETVFEAKPAVEEKTPADLYREKAESICNSFGLEYDNILMIDNGEKVAQSNKESYDLEINCKNDINISNEDLIHLASSIAEIGWSHDTISTGWPKIIAGDDIYTFSRDGWNIASIYVNDKLIEKMVTSIEEQTSEEQTSSSSSSYSDFKTNDDCKILDMADSRSGNLIVIEGSVKNEGTTTHEFIKVKVSMKDADGNTIDTDNTYACGSEGLAPGESTKWKVYFDYDIRFKKYSATVYDYD